VWQCRLLRCTASNQHQQQKQQVGASDHTALTRHFATGAKMCVINSETHERSLCVIAKLRRRSFQSYAASSKLDFIKAGPPKPRELPFLGTKKTVRRRGGKREEYVVRFKPSVYDQHDWICACCAEDTGGLFCWPCILFSNASHLRTWKAGPFKDMNNLSGEANRHARLESHLTSALALSNFGQSGRIDFLLNKAHEMQVTAHNKTVKLHILFLFVEYIF
jgi:hypothetical protein